MAIQRYITQSGSAISATASGTNTYTASLTPNITSYVNTQVFYIRFTNGNTGASTINIDTLGAISIVKDVSTALVSGDILAGQTFALSYNGTNFQIVGGVEGGGSGGGATLRNVSSTDTFATANETINCTANTFIVNLPTAVGIQGTPYTLVNSGTGIITLDANGTETINGSLTIDLEQYTSRTVQSDGTNWIII